MRVIVASPGRFHAFELAGQLAAAGHLDALLTAHWKRSTQPLDPAKVRTWPIPFSIQYVACRAGLLPPRLASIASRAVVADFDRWACRQIREGDVFHAMSGFCTSTHALARRLGMVTVCDRGSTHIGHQARILDEENVRWGIRRREVDPWISDRELEEYEQCDRIMTPSRFARQTFLDRGVPGSKLCLAPYGADLSLFRRTAPRDRVFRALFAGRIGFRKGVPYLLEAMAGLPSGVCRLWLAGEIEPEIRPLLARNSGRFEYLGAVTRSGLADYYSRASVLVLPSLEEGLALVQAQAMACGLPVIATPNTGAADLFDDGCEGFLMPVRSPEAIREKILSLRDDPSLWERMSHAAAARVADGWDRYGRTVVAHYTSSLRSRRAGGTR